MFKRLRRNRKSASIRDIVAETHLGAEDLITPLFVIEGENRKVPIDSMPGIYRFSIDTLHDEVDHLMRLGIRAIALFPLIDDALKSQNGDEASNPSGLIPNALRSLKSAFPTLTLIADVALDPYTSHGHDGIVRDEEIDNDLTLDALKSQAVILAEAGADILAPSDMMDGRIKVLRKALDLSGFTRLSLLSYTAKYASSLYSPFRDAIQTTLTFGDKKTYQMNPANVREALREALTDVEEGADMLMVKPGLPYLDVLAKIREQTLLPVGAYHVSGEYAMVMSGAKMGYLDAPSVFLEQAMSFKRAGADFIFTYAAPLILEALGQNRVVEAAACHGPGAHVAQPK